MTMDSWPRRCCMADIPVQMIVDALAQALRGITIANNYNTDLGLNVLTERAQSPIPAEPRATVVVTNKFTSEDGDRRPGNGRGVRGLIEFEVPASYGDAMARVIAADEDVERLLSIYHQMPNALPVKYDETVFLDRPEGVPAVGAQIYWSTGFRRSVEEEA